MKPKHPFTQLLAVLFALPFMGSFTQAAPYRIKVLETFDYPGTGNLTRPQKINDDNEIVGEFVDSSGATRGFLRLANGTFSSPIIEPNDTGNFTEGRGINNAPTICGDYIGSDGLFHGFFRSGSTFTEFDVPDSTSTETLGINDAGDFAGGFTPTSTGVAQPFVSIGGSVMPISIPGSTLGFSYQINATNEFVGYYGDSGGITHGFLGDSHGRVHFPIDPAGSTGTILFGINDLNQCVGRYSDSGGATHGIFFIAPHGFVVFDYPDSTFTSLNGINARGFICGRYIDSAGIEHGILARVRPTHGDGADVEMKAASPSSPIKSASPSSPVLPDKAPAS